MTLAASPKALSVSEHTSGAVYRDTGPRGWAVVDQIPLHAVIEYNIIT